MDRKVNPKSSIFGHNSASLSFLSGVHPFFFNFILLLFILFYFLTLQYCIGFAIHQNESATGIQVCILNGNLSSIFAFVQVDRDLSIQLG